VNYLSIAVSSIYFLIALFASTFLVESVLNFNQTLAVILVLFIWCSPGYLAAAIAKRHAVVHASIAGTLCFLLAVVETYIFEVSNFTLEFGYAWLSAAIVSFGFGGLVWCFKSWLFKAKS